MSFFFYSAIKLASLIITQARIMLLDILMSGYKNTSLLFYICSKMTAGFLVRKRRNGSAALPILGRLLYLFPFWRFILCVLKIIPLKGELCFDQGFNECHSVGLHKKKAYTASKCCVGAGLHCLLSSCRKDFHGKHSSPWSLLWLWTGDVAA